MTPEQFDKLPQYAQRVIEQQGEQLEALQRAVDEDSPYGTVRSNGHPNASYALGPGQKVRFPVQRKGSKGVFDQIAEVDVSVNPHGELEIRVRDGECIIQPVAANTILIIP